MIFAKRVLRRKKAHQILFLDFFRQFVIKNILLHFVILYPLLRTSSTGNMSIGSDPVIYS